MDWLRLARRTSGMLMLVEQARGQLPRPPGWRGRAVAVTAAFGAVGGVGVLGARGSKLFACAVFPGGALHWSDGTGKRMAARTQADVMRFNAPAAGCWIKQGGWPGLFRYSD